MTCKEHKPIAEFRESYINEIDQAIDIFDFTCEYCGQHLDTREIPKNTK